MNQAEAAESESPVAARTGPGAIARTADILRVLSYHGALSAREMARFLDEDKSTIQRAMQALEAAGLLARDPESELWSMSDQLGEIVQQGIQHRTLLKRAELFLGSLHARAKLPVRLAVPYGAQMLHVYRLPVRADPLPPGYRTASGYASAFPMPTTALGLAYLAHLDAAAREHLYARGDLGPLPAPRDAFEQQLAQVRAQGYAFSDGAFHAGGGGIAAPVFDPGGAPLAAVGVLGRRDVIGGPQRDSLGALVRGIAGDISHMLKRPPDGE